MKTLIGTALLGIALVGMGCDAYEAGQITGRGSSDAQEYVADHKDEWIDSGKRGLSSAKRGAEHFFEGFRDGRR